MRRHPTAPRNPNGAKRRARSARTAGLVSAGVAASVLAFAFPQTAAHAAAASGTSAVATAASPAGGGWILDANGVVTAYGGAATYGNVPGPDTDAAAVGIAPSRDGHGYWVATANGRVLGMGDARWHGSPHGERLDVDATGIAADARTGGYWVLTAGGRVLGFDAPSYGQPLGHLPGGVTARTMAATPDGRGYWVVTSSGGVLAYGDAVNHGSPPAGSLGSSVVAMTVDGATGGYSIVTAGGRVEAFDAPAASKPAATATPVVGGALVSSRSAYQLVTASHAIEQIPTSSGPGAGSGAQPAITPYFANGPFGQASSSSSYAAGSTSLSAALSSHVAADIWAYGDPIYTAGPGTPLVHVTCTEPWGTCPLSIAPVPVPADANAAPGSDGSLIIVDPSTHMDYEFWQFSRHGSQVKASWGAAENTEGRGVLDVTGGPGATGSGLALLGGVVTIPELESGSIHQALTFSSSLACNGTFAAPAVKTDGQDPSNCIPEGARVQLNPSIDLAAIPGITPFELMVGRALQTYGAICDNDGGVPMAFAFQTPDATSGNPYPSLGVPGDYYNMPHLPWSSVRVVNG